MKGRAVGLALASVLLVALLAPPAEARGRRHHHGFRARAVTGLLLFSPFVVPGFYYAPPYYPFPYHYPPPYYCPPPYYPPPPAYAPSCSRTYTAGHWAILPVEDGRGFTTYYYQWVPNLHETACP